MKKSSWSPARCCKVLGSTTVLISIHNTAPMWILYSRTANTTSVIAVEAASSAASLLAHLAELD